MTVVRMFWVFGSLFLRRRCVDNPHPLLFRFQPLMSGPVGGPNGRDYCDHGILRDGWHCKNVQNSVMDKSKRSVTSEITDCEAPEDRGARTDSNTESGRSELSQDTNAVTQSFAYREVTERVKGSVFTVPA